MKRPRLDHVLKRAAAAAAVLLLAAGCGTLLPKAKPQPAFYVLDGTGAETTLRDGAVRDVPALAAAASAPTLIVNPPHAAAGFDSPRILYVRSPHQLEYFAHSDWVDTPARMLAPLIVAALERGAAFRAVVMTPSAAAGDLRLDSEIVRLQHDFSVQPSQVRFTLRVTLVDNLTRRVMAAREFEARVTSRSEDTYGGVVAANAAVQAVLGELALFCAEAARGWPLPRPVGADQASGFKPGSARREP
jgi:cholesterol transport system auxiliary component